MCFLCQYSDLAEAERASILEKFRQVTTRWIQIIHTGAGNEDKIGKDEDMSHMIVVTDACLPLLNSGESPISGHLLINYELPTKKVWSFFFFLFSYNWDLSWLHALLCTFLSTWVQKIFEEDVSRRHRIFLTWVSRLIHIGWLTPQIILRSLHYCYIRFLSSVFINEKGIWCFLYILKFWFSVVSISQELSICIYCSNLHSTLLKKMLLYVFSSHIHDGSYCLLTNSSTQWIQLSLFSSFFVLLNSHRKHIRGAQQLV